MGFLQNLIKGLKALLAELKEEMKSFKETAYIRDVNIIADMPDAPHTSETNVDSSLDKGIDVGTDGFTDDAFFA